MGQKAKNAGKKQSKPSSGKVKARAGVISVRGVRGQEPSQEFMKEANEMIKINFHAHVRSRNKSKGKMMRKTDVDKNSSIMYRDTILKEQNTLI